MKNIEREAQDFRHGFNRMPNDNAHLKRLKRTLQQRKIENTPKPGGSGGGMLPREKTPARSSDHPNFSPQQRGLEENVWGGYGCKQARKNRYRI